MPLKFQPSPQMITLAEAEAVIKQLKSKGVPVSDLREISAAFGEVRVDNNPNYEDDGQRYQYIAKVWGTDQEVGLVRVELAEGGLKGFMKIASTSFGDANDSTRTWASSYAAVLGLPGVAAAVDAALALK